jgi:biotin operon repressor
VRARHSSSHSRGQAASGPKVTRVADLAYVIPCHDLILQGIAAGATSTATLAEHTGISTASVWRGLCRLKQSGQVFSPIRGVYRLTPSGAALLVLPDRVPPAALEPSAGGADDKPLVEPGPLVTAGGSGSGSGGRHDAMDPHEDDAALPFAAIASRFDWGAFALGGVVIALGGLVLGRHLLAVLAAQRAALAAQRAAPRPSVATEEAARPRPSQPQWPGVGPAW